MAMTANITRDEKWYLGEDKVLRFAVYEDNTLATPIDVAAFALSWKLTTRPGATATLTKTTAVSGGITVTGVFNATPALNTQRVLVAVDDTDTDALEATTWWHELKRTDAGLEGVIVDGTAQLLQPVHLS